MESQNIIEIDALTKVYKRKRQVVKALSGISLDIKKGEFIAITGPSGSGKSTLLQVIGGLDKPTSGSVVVDGSDIALLNDSELSTFRNKTIGFVFQFFYLQPFLNLSVNVGLPAMFNRTMSYKERKAREGALLEVVDLSDRSEHYLDELSGGQIQRAAIARALMNNPKIILADEPTGNLDSESGRQVVEVLKNICHTYGTTVVVVTHNPEIANQADRIINVQDGEIQ